MKRRLIKVIKGETGQVLPAVLVLMLIGGLLIAPSLSYASTSLNAGQIFEKKVSGLYAADAGIEDTLWCLKNDSLPSYPYQLPENVNQMQVTIEEPENKGIYALYHGDLIVVDEQRQPHYDELTVDGEMGEWEEEEEAYPYTITVTWQADPGTPEIKLREVGVRLPIGYSYQPGSASSFFEDELFSTDEPDDTGEQDQAGAYMLNWTFGTPSPYVSDPDFPGGEGPMPERTQTFYVTGDGALEGDYTWVGTHGEASIGQLGEVVGKLYRITATARPEDDEDGETTATVVADAMVYETATETEIRVILWQVNPPEE